MSLYDNSSVHENTKLSVKVAVCVKFGLGVNEAVGASHISVSGLFHLLPSQLTSSSVLTIQVFLPAMVLFS